MPLNDTLDMRAPGARAASQQRSINLALSARGITALQAVLGHAVAADVLKDAIPMRGRMIHDSRGRLESQAYDRHGQVRAGNSSFPPRIGVLSELTPQCINSLDRAVLNETLLTKASETPGIRIFFKHKVQAIDFDRKTMSAHDQESGEDVHLDFDFIVGADGSYSVVRRQLQRVVR
jgi:kynurenine 3-monooxygenase